MDHKVNFNKKKKHELDNLLLKGRYSAVYKKEEKYQFSKCNLKGYRKIVRKKW